VVIVLLDTEGSGMEPPVFTLTLDGRPLVEHSVTAALDAGLRTFVVSGPGVEAPLAHLAHHPDLEVLHASRAHFGAALASLLARLPAAPSHVIFHDPCCPLLPASALSGLVRHIAERPDEVIVLSRPVTDTVKSVRAGEICETVPRGSLRVLGSPVVVPFADVADLDLSAVTSLPTLLSAVSVRRAATHVVAPVLGQVVAHAGDAVLLQALRDLSLQTRA
jgi:2-C-methyl-D-erythritol 4-phosphate cytidylyltransferase